MTFNFLTWRLLQPIISSVRFFGEGYVSLHAFFVDHFFYGVNVAAGGYDGGDAAAWMLGVACYRRYVHSGADRVYGLVALFDALTSSPSILGGSISR